MHNLHVLLLIFFLTPSVLSNRLFDINIKRESNHEVVSISAGSFRRTQFHPLPGSEKSPKFTDNVQNYQERTLDDFQTRDSRLGFIRKVYSIVGIQMLATIGITAFIMSNRDVAYFLLKNFKGVGIISSLVSTAVFIALAARPSLRHKAPGNFIMVALFTACQSVVVGTLSSLFSPGLVCVAAMHTLTAFVAITLYSLQPNPRYDLSTWGNALLASGVSIFVAGLINVFTNIAPVNNLLSVVCAVFFAAYIGHDTAKIIGGKHHKHQYGQKEYIMAALNLYQDVVCLFIEILKLLAKSEQRNNQSQSNSGRDDGYQYLPQLSIGGN